jgi:hypothetical protein
VLRHDQGARTILILLGMIVVIAAVLFIVQSYETKLRTGSAAIQIVSSELQLPSRFEQSPQGRWLRYTYAVDGTTYTGYDFRQWTNVGAHDPKVCFDPADPGNHLLVDGRARCGIDNGP